MQPLSVLVCCRALTSALFYLSCIWTRCQTWSRVLILCWRHSTSSFLPSRSFRFHCPVHAKLHLWSKIVDWLKQAETYRWKHIRSRKTELCFQTLNSFCSSLQFGSNRLYTRNGRIAVSSDNHGQTSHKHLQLHLRWILANKQRPPPSDGYCKQYSPVRLCSLEVRLLK